MAKTKTVDETESTEAVVLPPAASARPLEALSPRSVNRVYEPSPYDELVAWSRDNAAPFAIDVDSDELVRAVRAELQRAVRHISAYVRFVHNVEAGQLEVQVQAVPYRKGGTRKYSSADIRTWAVDQGLDLTPDKPGSSAIPSAVRQAFKEAHGYA